MKEIVAPRVAETEAAEKVNDWRLMLGRGVNSGGECASVFGLNPDEIARAESVMPVRINGYYRSLIQSADDPLGRQVVPCSDETVDVDGRDDPLAEEEDSPVPHLVHRYPDRVLLLITYQCAVYCRFCTRKRAVGKLPTPSDADLLRAIEYIRGNKGIRDVIVSGGDPFILSDGQLGKVLGWLRGIPHLEIIRIDTRVPCVLPQRVTNDLCRELARHHPLYVNTHFNHPREVTAEAGEACARLADHGIPVGNQAVLLKGVNDSPEVMKELMQRLLAIRVRPYYLYQCDPVSGAGHFRTSVRAGLEIMSALRGHTSGIANPAYVIDAPGGGGKVPVLPESIVELSEERVVVRNYEGRTFTYPQPAGPDSPAR